MGWTPHPRATRRNADTYSQGFRRGNEYKLMTRKRHALTEHDRIRMREYGRKYYAEHRDEMQAKHRKWASENKDRVLEKSRRWRHKNRERYNQLCADTRMRLRMQVMRHYGGDPPMCACCGETELDFLTIDHINGGGRKHREVVC